MLTHFILSFFIIFIFIDILFTIIPIFALSPATYFSLGALKWIIRCIIFIVLEFLTLNHSVKLSDLTFIQSCLCPSIVFTVLRLNLS